MTVHQDIKNVNFVTILQAMTPFYCFLKKS